MRGLSDSNLGPMLKSRAGNLQRGLRQANYVSVPTRFFAEDLERCGLLFACSECLCDVSWSLEGVGVVRVTSRHCYVGLVTGRERSDAKAEATVALPGSFEDDSLLSCKVDRRVVRRRCEFLDGKSSGYLLIL